MTGMTQVVHVGGAAMDLGENNGGELVASKSCIYHATAVTLGEEMVI